MKNLSHWQPTKYILSTKGKWVPNPHVVGKRYSFFTAQLQINSYQAVISKYAKGKLLDCGAGTVPYFGIYKDKVDDVVCIDWGESYHELSYIDNKVDLTEKLPFQDKNFDTVLLADVIEHLPNPTNIFSETARILKKGGHALIFVPFMYGVHEGPHDYHRYTSFALERYATDVKLRPVFIEPYGGGPDVLVDIGNKMFDKKPVLYFLHRLIWGFLKFVGIYSALKKKFTNQFPLGYSFVVTKD